MPSPSGIWQISSPRWSMSRSHPRSQAITRRRSGGHRMRREFIRRSWQITWKMVLNIRRSTCIKVRDIPVIHSLCCPILIFLMDLCLHCPVRFLWCSHRMGSTHSHLSFHTTTSHSVTVPTRHIFLQTSTRNKVHTDLPRHQIFKHFTLFPQEVLDKYHLQWAGKVSLSILYLLVDLDSPIHQHCPQVPHIPGLPIL